MILDFEGETKKYIELVNDELSRITKIKNDDYDTVKKAVRYSLLGSGKRLRPIIVIQFCIANGGKAEDALPFACAVEMIHCYSLIHDDLPCMDDDDMRRGKPSCHKQFGEANALLAGDALLTLAFETIAQAPIFCGVSETSALSAVSVLALKAGIDGMIGGQVMDIENEGRKIDADILAKIHAKKTSKLITAAVLLGCIAGGLQDKQKLLFAEEYGLLLGLAFQAVDDILDVVGDESVLGKPIGSDKENQKTTYPSLLGLEKAKEVAAEYSNAAVKALEKTPHNEYLLELTVSMLNRSK